MSYTRLFVFLAGAGILVSQADASLLTVAGMVANKYTDVYIKVGSTNMHVYAGPQKAKLEYGDWFDAYCVDLSHWNSPPTSYDVTVLPLSGETPWGSNVAKLYNAYAGDVNSKWKGAALQLAIWDMVVDNGDGLGVGTFKAYNLNSNITNWYNNYMSGDWNTAEDNAWYFKANSHPNGKNQNLIGPVPEPGTMAVLGLGAVGLLRRRKKKSA